MGAGLDELIESLLTEIAFSGVRGCSVTNFLSAIDSFYGSTTEGDELDDGRVAQEKILPGSDSDHQPISRNPDLAVASKVWAWLANRPDVSIGTDGAFNHLSLEQVLNLPEEEEPLLSEPSAAPSAKTKAPTRGKSHVREAKDEALMVRPRLHVSEEHQWRTITGHGPDLKRVPLFEWRALVDIASVKEKGILQGDLVRLTGQDKRSLPTRTDALARKGYIIKQPIVLRGGKSSKLWLAQFSDHAKALEEREGLDYSNIDLSRAALTSDLNPVPFCGKWNAQMIDYLALAQAFVAIVKAWTLIRYCDARAKLGVEERVRQMRALAKTCRWLTNIGALSFVGAKFAGSNRLFKDCVKYIRDPTPAEWSLFRATPKTRMVVPSGRIGKRGEASRAVHASLPGGSRGRTAGKKSQSIKSRSDLLPNTSVIPPPWHPQKPVPNTAFDVIKRSGSKGTSNAAICRQTLGYNYRRLTAAMTGSISMPTNSQPSHLKNLAIVSQLSRIGKTMTYTFFANSEIAETRSNEDQTATSSSVNQPTSAPKSARTAATQDYGVFSQPELSKFPVDKCFSTTQISQVGQTNRNFAKKLKRKNSIPEDQDDEPPTNLPRRLGRPPKRARIGESSSRPTENSIQPGADNIPTSGTSSGQQQKVKATQPMPLDPGAYRGLPHSLDSAPKRKGRRPRSLVIIFRSEKLRNPSFFGASSTTSITNTDATAPALVHDTVARSSPIQVEDSDSVDTASIDSTTSPVVSEVLHTRSKSIKAGKKGLFWCEKCGNSWKNSNGLDYHLTKSKTACNSAFVPASTEVLNSRKRKITQPRILECAPVSRLIPEVRGNTRLKSIPKELAGTRVERMKQHISSDPHHHSVDIASLDNNITVKSPLGDGSRYQVPQGAIVLKDLEVYNATDHRRTLSQGTSLLLGPQQRYTGNQVAPDCTSTDNGHMNTLEAHHQSKLIIPVGSPTDIGVDGLESLNRDKPQAHSYEDASNEHNDIHKPLQESPSLEHLGSRKHLPSILPYMINYPGIVAPTATLPSHRAQLIEDTAEASDVSVPASQPLADDSVVGHSRYRPLASFARSTRPNASFGARRRDRTMQIIEYLLEHNDGVFPGVRSLFMAIISVWVKEFKDLAPPDRKICQTSVSQLERESVLKQLHFFFFDDQGKMQECVVIAKADTKNGLAVYTSDDPRVVAVKEKMREMFPEAYVPNAFSLSLSEVKLFDELASQGKEYGQTRALKATKGLKTVQDIETLHYEDSVLDDISSHKLSGKRPVDDVLIDTQTASKRHRVDAEQTDRHEKPSKPRRRPDKHEMWDSGKLAVYIWSQRQKPSATWEQHLTSLQDPMTGAWSWVPNTDPSQLDDITTVLSSAKTARHFDASLNRKGRRALTKTDTNTQFKKRYQHGSRRNCESSAAVDNISTDGNSDDLDESTTEESDDESALSNSTRIQFSSKTFHNSSYPSQQRGSRTSPPAIKRAANSIVNGLSLGFVPSTKEQLPRDIQDILSNRCHSTLFNEWANPAYGSFLRDLRIIGKWERSSAGSGILTQRKITLEPIYISLSLGEIEIGAEPTSLEWLSANQLTADNIPDEVKITSVTEDEFAPTFPKPKIRKVGKTKASDKTPDRIRHQAYTSKSKAVDRKQSVQDTPATLPSSTSLPPAEGFFEYKARDLTTIPRQPRGRINKPTAQDDKLGSQREDELVAACVVFRTLLGGLDRNLDIGLLLKLFPGMSLSAIKRFWPRIARERKSYVQALTAKFQSAFLEAYENGELPPLDYDDVENYDWATLISWTTQLETHEDVKLPESKETLHRDYNFEPVTNDVVDWRETWFATTSAYNRIEAVTSEKMTIPLPPSERQDRTTIDRARTWVRCICCTSLRGVNVREKLIPKLLELGDGDVAKTNQILETAVTELNKEKVITRTKGKDLGGNFRIHGMFSKQLEKMAGTAKLRQAAAFKTQLDEAFRRDGDYTMPYASDDGSILTVLNLQAHGRIRTDALGLPDIPFGFEPGNYEGRTFPKSYYHFKTRLVPTERYLFDDDMALLSQAARTDPPIEASGGQIPIWVNFFGGVNATRWADYASMVAFTLAVKGPIAPAMCATLLKPMLETFEAELIVDWLDRLGLIHRAVDGCGITVAEWWWLVVGRVVESSDTEAGHGAH